MVALHVTGAGHLSKATEMPEEAVYADSTRVPPYFGFDVVASGGDRPGSVEYFRGGRVPEGFEDVLKGYTSNVKDAKL
jgi:hypothetical protein